MLSFSDRSYLVPALLKGYVDAIAAHETSILQYEQDYGVEVRILNDSLLDVGPVSYTHLLAGWPHRSDFVPALPGKAAEDKVLAAFGGALEVRDVVTKALEDARGAKVINKSQEAIVSVTAPQATLDALSAFDASVFEELFIVSGVTFAAGDELACEVKPAEGDKCPRCWNYRELGGNANHADVCQRCGDALDAIGFTEE